MSVNVDELRALPASEKLRLVELLWDDLGDATEPIPLPVWVEDEASKRRDELLKNPTLGVGHEEVWRRIDCRNG